MSFYNIFWKTPRSGLIKQIVRKEHRMIEGLNLNGSLSKIIEDGLAETEFAKTPTILDRIMKMTEYFTLDREPVQGKLTLLAYDNLVQASNIDERKKYQAVVLAWVIELSYFLIMDDVEDGAKTRCGKLCWHLLPEVKTLAMNDACMFRSVIYEIIRKNFEDPLKSKLVDTVNEASIQIAIGQHMDVIMARSRNYSLFTPENYAKIVKYKCTCYTLKLPLISALLLSDKDNTESFELVEDLCKGIGASFQIENDVMDCYDEESKTGKTGTDIQQGKCTWLAVRALQRCSPSQRKIFYESYGKRDTEHVTRIKEIYKNMSLLELYKEEQSARYKHFINQVRQLPKDAVPSRELFLKLLDFIKD